MDILGLSVVQASLTLAIIGIAITNLLGYFTSEDRVNWRKVGATSIIAFIITVPVIANQLGSISVEGDWQQLVVVFGLIATVSGIDLIAKKSANLITKSSG
tara:strand:+ start:69 stop:371 length:303 start_codon:yes stop_codon:yes gene_type:complete